MAYFLQATGQTTGGSGAPLFTLFRRQFGILDVPGTSVASQLNAASIAVAEANVWAGFSEISCKKSGDISVLRGPVAGVYPDTIRFNSPADLTMPIRRFGMLPGTGAELAGIPADPLRPAATVPPTIASRFYPTLGELPDAGSPWRAATAAPFFSNPPPWQNNPSLQGADMLLTDVISFEVKPLVAQAGGFTDLASLVSYGQNSVFLTATNTGAPAVFDTWSNQSDGVFDYSSSSTAGSPLSIPMPVNILALKITIRLWDAKTQQARQVTLIQDL